VRKKEEKRERGKREDLNTENEGRKKKRNKDINNREKVGK
jgi:hypothetical protein